MNRKTSVLAVLSLLLLALPVMAHLEEPVPAGMRTEALHIKGYDNTLLAPEIMKVNEEVELTIIIKDHDDALTGADIQGQIMEPDTGKDIFYSATTEVSPGKYSFTWKPSFAGNYFVQFIFLSSEDVIYKPTFALAVQDPRADYWLKGSFIAAFICFAVGLYAGFPKKKGKFNSKSLITGIVLGGIFIGLGYSVAYFYQAGGEAGYVVCDEEGVCEIAVHWHSELELSVCGEHFLLPKEAGDLDEQHTHKEPNRLHFHSLTKATEDGELLEPERLRAGGLFEQLDMKFNSECFRDKCNGDLCNGQPGSVKMYVNGASSTEFDKYVWKDGDVISISFE